MEIEILKKILYSIERAIYEFNNFYEMSKEKNNWNEDELYFKLGTVILWIGVWINKKQELNKKGIKISLKLDEQKLIDSFLGVYNAQKHSIKVYNISINSVACFPSRHSYPSINSFPSYFSCKWIKLDKKVINRENLIDIYNEVLSDKEIIPTLKEIQNLVVQKTKEMQQEIKKI